MDSREPREDHELAGLRQMILDFEDFINTPPQYEELRRVCEYRNELYRHWEPLARAVLAALRRPSPVAESTPAAPANTGRDEVLEALPTSTAAKDALERAIKAAGRHNAWPSSRAAKDTEAVVAAIRALSSPTVSTVDEEGGGA